MKNYQLQPTLERGELVNKYSVATESRHGSWVVGHGSRVVSRGSWVVGHGLWVVGRGSWVVGRGCM